MAGKRTTAAPSGPPAGLARAVLGSLRREAQRRRRRVGLRAALWSQFHQWVHDDAVEALLIHGVRALYTLRAGTWQRWPTPFRSELHVRELVRRLTLEPRRAHGPVHRQLPEGFELFSWEDPGGDTVVFLRRSRPRRPTLGELEALLRGDGHLLKLLARQVGRREPILVCGPGQHAREQVLVALTALLDTDRRIVWLVDGQRPVPVARAAAVVTADCRRLQVDPQGARALLDQVLALAPDWIIAQDAPPSLLAAVEGWTGAGGLGFLAATAFPLQRGSAVRRGTRPKARSSQDLPVKFRWILEVAGYRRPVVEGVWRALPADGEDRWWQRLPVNGVPAPAGLAAVPAAGASRGMPASRAAEGPAALYAGDAGQPARR